MPKSDSKSRILYIYRILVEETDSEHQITIQQIIDRLEERGLDLFIFYPGRPVFGLVVRL